MASSGGDERLDNASAADPEARVDALDARLEVVVERDRHDADRQAEGGGDQRLGNAAGDHAEAAVPVIAMLWKARMMPSTVPNSPMNGAAEPIVASTQREAAAPCASSNCRCSAMRSSSVMSGVPSRASMPA